MHKKTGSTGAFIIASAIVWGAVILGCSLSLKGTACYDKIQNVLVGGFLAHLLLIWGPMTIFIRKTGSKSDSSEEG
jgi:hypothetical protein